MKSCSWRDPEVRTRIHFHKEIRGSNQSNVSATASATVSASVSVSLSSTYAKGSPILASFSS